MKLALQLAEVEFTGLRLQFANGVDDESKLKLIEPPGVIGAIPVSFTVVKHEAEVFTGKEVGLHVMVVVVGSVPTLRDSEPQELKEPPLFVSPLYSACHSYVPELLN